ncbi:MAG: type II toxin-antitoxin system prevent-host-death family antitoxin [Serpentinimonas sp.]|nr:MAG: hypothetical protein JM57_02000 [Comamonadaceae bacterium BICA1-1]MDO9610956.1 type II toxin-antitoxin system prevent-host-death family antitoxin [Serpentinimonas sp.]
MKTISAAEANRHFSGLLRDVATGQVVTVLSRGKPVATISPAHTGQSERELAKLDLLARLRLQQPSGARNWNRAELYEG